MALSSPRIIILTVACSLLLGNIQAGQAADITYKLESAVGIAFDRLTWNIADSDGSPNILSELTWRNLVSGVGRVEGQIAINRWSLNGEIGYGIIFSGNVRDDDFLGDNRTLLFSRSESETNDHDLQSAAATVGYALYQEEDSRIRLLIGGRVYRQRLRITNGTQFVPATGPFSNLNSTYTATWYGPTFGLAADLNVPRSPMWAHLVITGMPAWYKGRANWNLRSDFQQDPSFEHKSFGWGLTTMVKLAYPIGNANVFVGWRRFFFTAEDGTDTVFFATGAASSTSLNEVKTESNMGFFGMSYTW